MMVLFTHKQLSEAGGPTLMQGSSIIIRSSVVALMLNSVDGPLSLRPIQRHLGRLAQLNLSAVLSKQMRDPIQRIGLEIGDELGGCV